MRRAGGDLVYGVKAIAEALGVKERQALHLVETDRLPIFREGRVICSRRSALAEWLDQRLASPPLRKTG